MKNKLSRDIMHKRENRKPTKLETKAFLTLNILLAK